MSQTEKAQLNQTTSTNKKIDRIFYFSRIMDYVLVAVCLVLAVYFGIASQWFIVILCLSSAAISFLVAHYHVAQRVAQWLLLRRHAK